MSDDHSIRLAYSAADVAVLTSTEEAFGKTAAEALACGTPCVVFADTGMGDVVSDRTTGFVATRADSAMAAEGVRWVLADQHRWTRLSEAGQVAARERFSSNVVARHYVDLYNELIGEIERDGTGASALAGVKCQESM